MRAPHRRSARGARGFLLGGLALGVFLSGCQGEGRAGGDDPVARFAAGEEAVRVEALGVPIRPEVSGLHGAVVSGHPLASAAGYEVLRAGGNAVDAAVTMAAVLAVVRPHMNGVGGDAFALIHPGGEGPVQVLNASGRAGALATPAFIEGSGAESMPGSGALTVTVPGAVSGWAAALERHGTWTLARALEPAIRVAEEGFVVTPTLAEDLASVRRLNEAGQALYAPGGEPVRPGQILRNPALAATLRTLAREGPGALYGGSVGAALADFLEAEGGHLRIEDFRLHAPEWTTSASVEVLGKRVHTVPPNSQGMVVLQMLGMVDAWLEARGGASGLAGASEDGAALPPSFHPGVIHALVEARKLAFTDRDRWVADPATDPAPVDDLLSRAYLAERAGLIEDRVLEGYDAGEVAAVAGGADDDDPLDEGDTVYLMAVDAQGNAVSWIQSLFSSFGSQLVEPTTGIVLQNRGAGFTLEAGHPNRIAPGKRPFHTLMATLVTDLDGRFLAAIGTPGGDGQPQTVAQGFLHLFLSEMGPQAAVEAPRFRSEDDRVLLVEDRYPRELLSELADRGHELSIRTGWTAPFGNMQVILRAPEGTLRTGADMRREGAAVAW